MRRKQKLKIHNAEFSLAGKSSYCASKTNAWHADEAMLTGPLVSQIRNDKERSQVQYDLDVVLKQGF